MPFTVHTRDSPKCILLLDSVLSSPVLCVCASLFLVSPSQLVHRRRQGQRRRPAAPRRQLEQPGRRLQLLRGEPATAGVGSVGSKLDSSIVPAQRRRRRRLNDRLYAFRIIVPNMVRIKLIGWCVNRDLASLFECSSSSDQSLNPQEPHRIHLADASATQVHPTHAAARVPATHRDSRPAALGGLAGGRRGARACVGVVFGGPGLPRLAGSTAQVASLSSSSRRSTASSSASGEHSRTAAQ